MEPFYRDYHDQLQKLHAEIEQLIGDLPQAALDWMPGEGMNSLAVMAFHVAGAERYWIGDVIAGEPSGRDRGAEFHITGLDARVLQERLSSSLAHSRVVLEGLSLQELHDMRVTHDGRQFSVGWVLNHALEHIAIHVGHMQVTRQFWEQEHS
jgi:uncharacterized damage-inducible protein DinB